MHGLMMDAPLLITEIMRFARPQPPGRRDRLGHVRQLRGTAARWRDVFRRARQLANALTAAGVKPGDRVATLAWNDYRHLELYYAVSCIGAVLHTINPRLFPEQLEYIINHADDRLLFVDPTLLPVLAAAAGQDPERRARHRADQRRRDARGRSRASCRRTSRSSPGSPTRSTGRTSTSAPRARSATRRARPGNPKGVLYSHRSTVLHAYAGCMVDAVGVSAQRHRSSPWCRCSTPMPGACRTTRR